MKATPLRFLGAAAWPLTIWTSLTHLGDHSTDDYVERTSPIVATAVAFWACVVALAVFANPGVIAVGGELVGEGVSSIQLVRRTPSPVVDVLWLVTPVLYLIGLWLFTAREEAFPR